MKTTLPGADPMLALLSRRDCHSNPAWEKGWRAVATPNLYAADGAIMPRAWTQSFARHYGSY